MKTLIALLALALSLNSFAADKKKVSKKKKSLTEVLKENNITKSDLRKELKNILNESQANREGKRISFLIGVGGRHAMATKNYAVEYYLNQNTSFGLNYSQGEDSYAYYGDQALREMKASIYEGYSKFFLGNSFYAKTGFAYRVMKGESTGSYDYDSGRYFDADLEEKKTDGTFSVDIGNQWQWENLTIAMNWIGLNYQVLGDSKYDNKDGITANLLGFSIGASF